MTELKWSRIWIDELVDDSFAASESDGQWGEPSCEHRIELTPAELATLQAQGTLVIEGHLLVSSEIDQKDYD